MKRFDDARNIISGEWNALPFADFGGTVRVPRALGL